MSLFSRLLRLYSCFGVLLLQWNDAQRFAGAFAVLPKTPKLLLHSRRTHGALTPNVSSRMITLLSATENKESDDLVNNELSEEERLQRDLDLMMNPESKTETFGFNADNFDQTKLPVPLFTGLVVMAFSLYMIGYFLYVGLNGFPEDDTLPRPF